MPIVELERVAMWSEEQSRVVETLRSAIGEADIRFVSGDRLLPERHLSAALGIPRRLLRDALNMLQGEGLIFRRQGQGTFVREVNVKTTSLKSLANRTSPHDIIEVRQQIEPILAGLAAIRATQVEIDQMKHFVHRAAVADSPNDYEKWDSAFHSKIAESVRNGMYRSIFRLMNSVRKEHHWVNSRSRVFIAGVSKEMVQQHQAIVEAIQARNTNAAESAMRTHILTAGVRIHEGEHEHWA
jgi:GntR family transcriptional repressor for pyruvate dehydrogenase complex